MKLVQFVTRSDTIGGAQKYILETSCSFRDDGHEVTVFSGDEGVFCNEVKRRGLNYIGLNSLVRNVSLYSDIKSTIAFRSAIKKLKPDVVIIHSAKAGLIGRLALIGFSNKKIFIAHGWSHIRASKSIGKFLYSLIENFLSLFCDKVICISKQDLIYANEKLLISKNKTCLLYSGVIEPVAPMKLSTNKVYNVLTVTRFQHPKDFDTLLMAMSEVNKVCHDWIITVLGDGEEFEYSQRKTLELGLSDKFKFLGFQEELSEFYVNSDLVILISKSEGLPLSLIEAMSYRKPILASNVGGVSELIDDGVTGYLVPPSDYLALSHKMFKVFCSSKEELSILGENSYEKYKREFSFDKMIKNLYKHF
ncbi:glycosyltransferase family 4 protein [Shewanella xiamenensis]|uniref:glycosyltransferase family 4 protein n=1 Tax=Shewanella xiamenensis TaxID=332186 RepID=UPI0004D9E7BD|nr:glycosyltransferase family 4 protein [Shewanella xiamenensis]KEK27735.1 WbwZ [Shewanella xiamenensis]